jgi:anti-anti-sigma factor
MVVTASDAMASSYSNRVAVGARGMLVEAPRPRHTQRLVSRTYEDAAGDRATWHDDAELDQADASSGQLAQEPCGGIDLVRHADATVVALWGAIDASLRAAAGRALAGALERDVPIVVDATRATLVDSAGLAFLIQLCTLGRDEGMVVSVVGASPTVAAAIHLVGCDDALRPLAGPDALRISPRSAA